MITTYAGSNITGTTGLIAVDKVGNHIRFYDPETLREIKSFPAPEPAAHELAISHDRRLAFVPLYGDGIYGNNRKPNNKVLAIDLEAQAPADVIDLGGMMAPHGLVATSNGKLWLVADIPNKLLVVDPSRRAIEAAYDCPARGAHQMALLPDESKVYVSRQRRQRPARDRHAHRHRDRPRAAARLPAIKPKRSRLAKLMFSPDGRYLVVTSYASALAWVIDARDLRRQTLVPVAKGPQGMAFPPDGKSVIVASHDSGLLTRIDLAEPRAVAAYDGGSGIEVLAYY
jgi:DNA-binding beta-propeller fold protein YncE